MIKKCQVCGQEFKSEQDVLQYGDRWRVCSRGFLWFNCKCNATLTIAKGKFDWYSPEAVLSPDARMVFNKLPQLKTLPHIPSVVMELQQLIQNENVTSLQLATMSKKAPILAANILKIANSIRAGDRAKEIKSLEHAISYIGLRATNDIVAAASVRTFPTSCQVFKIESFWEMALLTGRIAENLAAEFCSSILPHEAYLAGCLCNIGKLIMSICFPEITDEIAQSESQKGTSWSTSESNYGIVNHLTLGEIGASFWGMPDFVVDVASKHHNTCTPGGVSNVSLCDLAGFASQLAYWVVLEPYGIDRGLLQGFAAKFGFHSEAMLEAYVHKILHLRAA